MTSYDGQAVTLSWPRHDAADAGRRDGETAVAKDAVRELFVTGLPAGNYTLTVGYGTCGTCRSLLFHCCSISVSA